MANHMVVYCSIILFITTYTLGLDANCPLSSKMTSCSPKCKDDTECLGRKCCPNICNSRSCVPANQDKYAGEDYKTNSHKSATGTYCGNVKCNSYEKCELDRTTKRQRCVRS